MGSCGERDQLEPLPHILLGSVYAGRGGGLDLLKTPPRPHWLGQQLIQGGFCTADRGHPDSAAERPRLLHRALLLPARLELKTWGLSLCLCLGRSLPFSEPQFCTCKMGLLILPLSQVYLTGSSLRPRLSLPLLPQWGSNPRCNQGRL